MLGLVSGQYYLLDMNSDCNPDINSLVANSQCGSMATGSDQLWFSRFSKDPSQWQVRPDTNLDRFFGNFEKSQGQIWTNLKKFLKQPGPSFQTKVLLSNLVRSTIWTYISHGVPVWHHYPDLGCSGLQIHHDAYFSTPYLLGDAPRPPMFPLIFLLGQLRTTQSRSSRGS